MLTVLSILGVLAVLFVAAAVATREGPILADAPPDAADVELPDGPLQPEDLRAVRFALAVRGYRMDEVDRVIERAASELAERDDRILALEKAKAGPGAVAAPAASVVVSKPATGKPAAVAEAPDEPIVPTEPPSPIVPTEPPLESPPAPPEPATPDVPEPDVEPEQPTEPQPPTEPEPVVEPEPPAEPEPPSPEVPDDAAETPPSAAGTVEDDAADREPAASLLGNGDAGTSDAVQDVDATEPPPAPPIEVAVVRTEVAPLPSSPSLPAEPNGAADTGPTGMLPSFAGCPGR